MQPPPEQILWSFGQWQPLYKDLQKKIPCIEFIRGIPDYLNNSQFFNPAKRNLIIFDDLMTKIARRLRAKFWPDCAILDTNMKFGTVVDHD